MKFVKMNYTLTPSKIIGMIAVLFLLAVSPPLKAQIPTVTMRFANPTYNCVANQYCVDVEFLSDSVGVEIFGVNVRFFYPDTLLELDSFTNFQGGYGPSAPDPPIILTGNSSSGMNLFGFPGPAEFVNGAIQLVDNSQPPILLDTAVWTLIFSICFTVDGPAMDTNFCPPLVLDLEVDPNNGGFLTGDDGVVITVTDPDPNIESAPAFANVVQFNWEYSGDGSAPFGMPVEQFCISLDCTPVITCPADVTIECFESTSPDSTGIATATIECGEIPVVTFEDSITAIICPGSYTILRTFIATNVCNLADSCTQIITVIDTTAPAIVCPGDTIVNCTSLTDTLTLGAATAIDSCDTLVLITFADMTLGGSCPQEYTITRTWIATDDCFNSSSCVQIITVQDTTAPVIVCPSDTIIDCTSLTDVATLGSTTATDSCDAEVAITSSDVTVAGECPQEYTINRTWTATDDCLNSSSCVQIITVQDTTSPTFDPLCQLVFEFFTSIDSLCPADADLSIAEGDTIGEDESYSVGDIIIPSLNGCLFDNCTNPDSLIARVDSISMTGDNCDLTIIVMFTIIDECGNESDTPFICTIIVHDDLAPVITCPASVTIECTASTLPANTGTATATDDCDTTPTIMSSDVTVAGGCPQEYVITRTWTATDDCGNSSSCTQTITVDDSTAPVITCPASLTIECTASTLPANTGTATATDNCDAVPAITSSDVTVAGGCPQEYVITRTWRATDDCGNSSSCTQ
ncbi:MAG: hypothetical protein ABIQ11_02995, partial [Saprospiraceae bacterium]